MTNNEQVPPTEDESIAYLELLLISNMRLYDVLLNIFAESAGEAEAQKLRALHMSNQFFYPPVVQTDVAAADS